MDDGTWDGERLESGREWGEDFFGREDERMDSGAWEDEVLENRTSAVDEPRAEDEDAEVWAVERVERGSVERGIGPSDWLLVRKKSWWSGKEEEETCIPDIGSEASPRVMSCCRFFSFGEISPRDDASLDVAMADEPAVGPAVPAVGLAPSEVAALGQRPPPPGLEAGAGLSSKHCVHARRASNLSAARLAWAWRRPIFVSISQVPVQRCMHAWGMHPRTSKGRGEREGH